MMELRLQYQFGALERALRRARLWRELALAWAAGAGVGMLLMLIDARAMFHGHTSGSWSGLLLWILPALASAAASLIVWRRHRRRPAAFPALIAAIERDYPELRHLLSAALEQEPNSGSGQFSFLQLRVIDKVLAHRERSEWERDVKRKLALARNAHHAALAGFFAILLMLGHGSSTGHSVLGPLLAREITVTPGDTEVERGTGIVISARFGGRPPAEAALVLVSASGKSKRIPLARHLADPVFGASLTEVTEDGLYRIEYGGEKTRDYKIRVFDYPALTRADAQLQFPSYTGLTNKTIRDTRRVTAVEGTRLTYTLELNKPVASARLVAKAPLAAGATPAGNLLRPPAPVANVEANAHLAHGADVLHAAALGNEQVLTLTVQSNAVALLNDYTLTNSGRYSLELVDADGRTNKFPTEFSLQALPDRPPTLKLAFPRGDQRVSSLEELQLQAEATDDFGLLKYGVGFSLAGQDLQFVELGESAPANEKRQFSHLIPLEKLGAEVDQVLSYFAWADDHGPDGEVRRSFGDVFFAEVRPFEEIFRRDQSGGGDEENQGGGQQQGGQQGNQQVRLAELQKQIVIATWKLQQAKHGCEQTPDTMKTQTNVAQIFNLPFRRLAHGPWSARTCPRLEQATCRRHRPSGGPVFFAGPLNAALLWRRVAKAVKAVTSHRTPKLYRLCGARFALLLALLFCAAPLLAQQRAAGGPPRGSRGPQVGSRAVTNYASDLVVVQDAQAQALEQAQEMLAGMESGRERTALETAIKEMERSTAALEQAKASPEKLAGAIAAQQAAYQALLKVTPREYRVSRSRSRSQSGGGAGQANQRQLDQLEMQREENRYETERQARSAPNPQQREQLQIADRLKELAQRQQDLNERLRELQTALQAARTEQEREEIQRQLKRLRDEERQMLADVDELRERTEQSPNSESLAEAREQLEQTRSDMQRASEELERGSPSQALAAGTRAQENMQNLREDLRRQTSSEFSEQMRELRNQARELARQQDEIAKGMEALDGERKELDNSRQRGQIAEQMARQQSGLTNLLSGMRDVTERAESTEPLLSQQLYDTLRRADQMHTDNLLEMGARLVDAGFLPQASEAERAARQNINELRQSVERAAESVLGNEAEALRYAQRELDSLARQLEREMGAGGTNRNALATGGLDASQSESNRLARAAGSNSAGNTPGAEGTNSTQQANGRAGGEQNGRTGDQQTQRADNNSQRGQRGETGQQGGGEQGNGEPGNRGEQQASNQSQQNGQEGQGNAGQGNAGQGGAEGRNAEGNRGNGNRGRSGQRQLAGNNSQNDPNNPSQREGTGQPGADREGDPLRQFAEQLGQGGGRGGDNGGGPITGDNFVEWSDRLRDVERVLDPADLRNQLATVRERVGAFRAEYRIDRHLPELDILQTQILAPMTQVRVWLQQELARQQNANSLVPLDRDPVPENYSELVRKYYEKLGSAQ